MNNSTEIYTDTVLETEYGPFKIRVYKDLPNKETIVLWTENLDKESPALTRVHSECFTGDVLHSCKCDCGKQLKKSLELIQENGGVLIYLRQEGRGIGLFEKMKAYQLQSEGQDTFEANISLGHDPDPRTYEMAKIALEDLNIKKIRLLTNNPSKVSEIAKQGVHIIERVPLRIRQNLHNKGYLAAKRDKFSHLLDSHQDTYYYKVQVQDISQVEEIKEFLSGKVLDPLLRIGIGVSGNRETLHDPDELIRLRDIQLACASCKLLESILHFSFTGSYDTGEIFTQIEHHFSGFDRIQLNDLEKIDIGLIKRATQLFRVDLPLDFRELSWLESSAKRKILRKRQVHIVIDPSKGKGKVSQSSKYQKAVKKLIDYGLHDITLCGGFGPDRLTTYFELRRYFKINFSIDAETYLKDRDKFSIHKIKLYLNQLIRFDDPNTKGIEQTRQFLEKNRANRKTIASLFGYKFDIYPGVFNPSGFPSTAWFADKISFIAKRVKSFCEIGCGSGVISCVVALRNEHVSVISTDIDIKAAKNTKHNSERLNLSHKMSIYSGDVLDGIAPENQFDIIFWALPFGYLDPGQNITNEEKQVFDPGYKSIRKLFQSAPSYLKNGGKLLLGFSSDLGHPSLLNEIAETNGFSIKMLEATKIKETSSVQFEIIECAPLKQTINEKLFPVPKLRSQNSISKPIIREN